MATTATAEQITVVFDEYDFWSGMWDGTDFAASEIRFRREVMKRLSELYNNAAWEYEVKSSGIGDEIYVTMSDGSDVSQEAAATLAAVASDVYLDQDVWVVDAEA